MDDHDRQLMLLGREHFQRGDYDKAKHLLDHLVERNCRFADVFYMLGVIAHHDGEFENARRHLEQAIRLNPNYTEAKLCLVVTYNDLGLYDDATRLHSELRVDAKPKSSDPFVLGRISNLHAAVAQAYFDAGLLYEASRELEKAVKLSPHFVDLRVKLGLIYRDLGELGLARKLLEETREINPNYILCRLTLGTLLLSAGECEAARLEFEHVLSLEPLHPAAKMYMRLAQAALRPSNKPQPLPRSPGSF